MSARPIGLALREVVGWHPDAASAPAGHRHQREVHTMRCPYCDIEDTRQRLHAHLADQHSAQVIRRGDETTGKLFYRLDCPLCDEYTEREVNPRGHDPTFLKTFEYEICLVAFDQLLYHLEAAH